MRSLFIYISIFLLAVSAVPVQARGGLYGHRAGDGYSVVLIGGGPAYLFGDVGGSQLDGLFKGTTFAPSSTRSFGVFGYRYIFPNNLSIRANLLYGSFYGNDVNTKLQSRNYQFKSTIIEASVQGEFFIFGGHKNYYNRSPHSMYVFAGAGNVTAMPIVTGNSRSTDVIKTTTTNAPIIPFGVGYELYVGNSISLGSEIAARYAFSDFLDGLRTPYSNNNDLLLNFTVHVSYNFSLGSFYR